jgi:hypothetical protein
MSKEPVGYIGLGHMGSGMVKSLIRNGFPVIVHDQRTQVIQSMVKEGAIAAGSNREVAERCRVVCSSLPDPAAVEAAALGEAGIIEGAKAGSVYIDMSTIDPNTSRKVNAALAEKGVRMLDCPVGKGPPEAATGDLTLMIGGDADLVEEMRPILSAMGSAIHHCGPAGAGAAAKLINNLVSCTLAASISIRSVPSWRPQRPTTGILGSRSCRAHSTASSSHASSWRWRTRIWASPAGWRSSSTCPSRWATRRAPSTTWRWAWASPRKTRAPASSPWKRPLASRPDALDDLDFSKGSLK